MDRVVNYWRSGRGLGNLIPPGVRYPEGEGFPRLLAELLRGEAVVEVGCGDGRLAAAFHPNSYLGVDISPDVVRMAQEQNPDHDFRVIDFDDPLPQGTCALLHTVLLHVPDALLGRMVERLGAYPRVMVGEILGREWRRAGAPPVFNRELADYEEAFRAGGFALRGEGLRIPYLRYKDTFLTVMDLRQKGGE